MGYSKLAASSSLASLAEAQKNGAAHVGLAPSSRLAKLHVGKEEAKLCCGVWPPHIRNRDDPAGTDMGTRASP